MAVDELGAIIGDMKRLHDNSTRPQLGKGGDPITWIEIYDEEITIENIDLHIDKCTPQGSFLIWDHTGSPLHGLWDVGSWATQRTATGSPEFDCVRFLELVYHQFFTEEFDNDALKDSGSTTAVWTNSGSATFTLGSTVAQSTKVLGSDFQIGSFNRATISITGSNTDVFTPFISLDGGENFEEMVFGLEKTFASNTGSDVRWKIIAKV